ncbi:MAG: AMP-binding protein [bacterium]
MSEFKGFILNGEYFDGDWIIANFEQLHPQQFDPFERQVLNFSGQWLSGEQTFHVRTSGSTGKPKNIALKRPQMISSARMTGRALDLAAADRALVCLPVTAIGGLMMLVRGFVLNLQMTIVTPTRNPFEEVRRLKNIGQPNPPQFDFVALLPLQMHTIVNAAENLISKINGMKAILLGGAPVSPGLLNQIKKIKAPVYHTFGMTETASHIALRRLNGARASEYFQVLPEVEIDQDEKGCLTIRSPITNNRKLTTHDLIEMPSKTRFRWLGRLDNVINSGGVKVPAEKIERVIESILPEIAGGKLCGKAFFVCGTPDEKFGEVVTFVFEGMPLAEKSQKQLRKGLSQKLPKFEIPRRFLSLEKFTYTANGKLHRSANCEQIVRTYCLNENSKCVI